MAAPELLLIFDTETTGLPRFERGGLPDPVTRTASYDGCRVVSVAWLVVRAVDHVVVAEGGGLIRPEGFVIPAEAQAVHGISTAHALAKGEPFDAVAGRFVAELRRCGKVGGHNVGFDVNVLAAEFARRRGGGGAVDYSRFALPSLLGLPRVCTMALGKRFLGQARNPKLGALYEALFGEPLDGAHDASVDTLACYRCLTRLAPAPLEFAPGPWRVTLHEVGIAAGAPQAKEAGAASGAPQGQAQAVQAAGNQAAMEAADPAPPQSPQPQQAASPESQPPQPPQPSSQGRASEVELKEAGRASEAELKEAAAALEAMGYPAAEAAAEATTMDCEAGEETQAQPQPQSAPAPIEVSVEPMRQGGGLPGPPAKEPWRASEPEAKGSTGDRLLLLRAAVVECDTLAEVAAVFRGAVGFAREHYPGRAVRTRVPALRRGMLELPVGISE